MAKFPEYSSISITPRVVVKIRWKTLKTQFNDESVEKRRQKWLYPRRDVIVRYNHIPKSDGETLWEFYNARKGSYSSFNFFLPEPEMSYPTYTGEYVGEGDGSTTDFNMPCKSAVTHTIYIDGVAQNDGSDYNYTVGGGTDGADKIDFDDSAMVTPSDGSIITADFQGILKIRCTFAEDIFEFETFRDLFVSTGVELRGVLNE